MHDVQEYLTKPEGKTLEFKRELSSPDKQMILDLLREFGSASRADIDSLLRGKLSDILTPEQQATKIKNLLQPSRRTAASLLTAEKEPRKSRQVSLLGFCPPPQSAGYKPLPFTATSPQSDAASRRKSPPHPRNPRHPWSSSAPSAFSAVRSSPRLRVSPSPRLPQ